MSNILVCQVGPGGSVSTSESLVLDVLKGVFVHNDIAGQIHHRCLMLLSGLIVIQCIRAVINIV